VIVTSNKLTTLLLSIALSPSPIKASKNPQIQEMNGQGMINRLNPQEDSFFRKIPQFCKTAFDEEERQHLSIFKQASILHVYTECNRKQPEQNTLVRALLPCKENNLHSIAFLKEERRKSLLQGVRLDRSLHYKISHSKHRFYEFGMLNNLILTAVTVAAGRSHTYTLTNKEHIKFNKPFQG